MKRSLPPKAAFNHESEPISVIIAARNEAHNLPRLLTSLAQLLPIDAAYEVIIVNDHSTDDSLDVLKNWDGQFGIRVLDFQQSLEGIVGKKAALQKGIDAAKYDVLAFTDADCVLPETWLQEITRQMSPQTDYILGYSTIISEVGESNLSLINFERSVYYALAGAGIYERKPITAMACNQVYRKSLFNKAGGFEGIAHLLSGDDDLLLMKMMPFAREAYYNPAPAMQVVSVEGKSVSKRHNKNIRRASKFRYHPRYLKLMSAFVFCYFVLFYTAIIMLTLGTGNMIILGVVTLKSLFELGLSQSHLAMVHKTHLGILYFTQIFVFPLQFIYYALRGSLGGYKWK